MVKPRCVNRLAVGLVGLGHLAPFSTGTKRELFCDYHLTATGQGLVGRYAVSDVQFPTFRRWCYVPLDIPSYPCRHESSAISLSDRYTENNCFSYHRNSILDVSREVNEIEAIGQAYGMSDN